MESNIISYVPAIVGIVSIAFFVLTSAHDLKSKIFFFLNVFIALWLACLFISDLSTHISLALWFLRFALFFGQIMFLIFYYFALVFPYQTKINKNRQILYSLPMIIYAVLLLTPIGVASVSMSNFNTIPKHANFIYTSSDAVAVLYMLVGIGILLYKYRSSDARQKSQIKFVLIGLSIAAVVNIFTNDVLTLLKTNTNYIDFGGFSVFIFSLFVGYAIIKHGFLDIRLLVARTFAYVLTLSSIAIAYSAIIIGILSHFNTTARISESQNLLYISTAVILSFTFQPIKRFFDKLSNRLFYRDAYDTQDFLDQLNKVLVSTYDLNTLLRKSTTTIEENLKPGFCLFVIKATNMVPSRTIGATINPIPKEELTYLETIDKMRQRLIVADDLDEKEHAHLKKALRSHKIAAVAKLASSSSGGNIGYIIMGSKKSGNLYSSQDLKVIEIISNELVITIQNALRFEEIKNFNLTLQAKVDEATGKLRHANERLKALDETKDDFISMASHQLRTPLTSVKGYISMVLEGDAGKITKMEKEMLGQAFFSSQRMVYLIADLLNVSRLKTGKFIIEPSKVNLATLVQQELGQLKETASSRKLSLNFDQPKDFPDVMLDETKTRQVIMNFVDNAIYYTPAGGHIDVRLIDNPTTIELRVEDDGIGVARSEQPHLFTKFYRAGNARKARPDGTGLGLFMAKKVIIAEGGSLVFHSEEGKGSTFGFMFSKEKISATSSK